MVVFGIQAWHELQRRQLLSINTSRSENVRKPRKTQNVNVAGIFYGAGRCSQATRPRTVKSLGFGFDAFCRVCEVRVGIVHLAYRC